MPRAKNKDEIIDSAESKFNELNDLQINMTKDELDTEFDFSSDASKHESHWKRDKNLRDVLIHLYEWHNLLLKWLDNNMNGKTSQFLPVGYNWKTYPDLNVEFFKKHQATPLEKAKELLSASHKSVMSRVEKFSNDELFVKKYYPWTGTSNLGSYFISVTASHYDWAIKKLKAHRKIVAGKKVKNR